VCVRVCNFSVVSNNVGYIVLVILQYTQLHATGNMDDLLTVDIAIFVSSD